MSPVSSPLASSAAGPHADVWPGASDRAAGGGVLRVAMVAGETSGDMLAASLLQALGQRTQVQASGIGGHRMVAAGLDAWWPAEKLAVRGYVEVLRHYREITGIRRQLAARLLRERPDVFVGVDAPDFNLDLERTLRGQGVPVVHFVGPSVWAWRKGRLKGIRRAVDHMLVLFPFEVELYRHAGIAATYVGHPLADMIPQHIDQADIREQLHMPAAGRVVALLPGSRQSEVLYMADLFVQTAKLLHEKYPDLQFLTPLVSRETRDLFQAAVRRQQAEDVPIRIMFGHAQLAVSAADAVVVASGTATLEVALLKRPMVIAYKMAGLSWQLMKRMKYMKHVGLPNILAGEELVPEFLQGAATPQALADATSRWLEDHDRTAAVVARFHDLHQVLRQGAGARAAEVVERMGRGRG